jgi:hypothetical protein
MSILWEIMVLYCENCNMNVSKETFGAKSGGRYTEHLALKVPLTFLSKRSERAKF